MKTVGFSRGASSVARVNGVLIERVNLQSGEDIAQTNSTIASLGQLPKIHRATSFWKISKISEDRLLATAILSGRRICSCRSADELVIGSRVFRKNVAGARDMAADTIEGKPLDWERNGRIVFTA
jgi:hypothetical protein